MVPVNRQDPSGDGPWAVYVSIVCVDSAMQLISCIPCDWSWCVLSGPFELLFVDCADGWASLILGSHLYKLFHY